MALIAAGVLAVSQFASGSSNDVANAAQEGGTTPPTPPTAPEPTAPPSTVPADSEAPDAQAPDDTTDLDGKIVIDIGDGDPIVIDLGDLGSLDPGGNGDLGKIEQCIGDLPFDLDIDGGPGLNVLFGSGDQITVTGPNGLTVLDFGEGDGSVTITKKDGEVTISSEGDVQENDLTAPDFSDPLPSFARLRPDLPVPGGRHWLTGGMGLICDQPVTYHGEVWTRSSRRLRTKATPCSTRFEAATARRSTSCARCCPT